MIRSGSRSISRSGVFTPRSRLPPSPSASRLQRATLSTTPAVCSPGPSDPSRSAWAAATESAHSVLTPPTTPTADPLSAIHAEIGNLKSSLFNLLGSSHPSLDTVAKYYFHAEGKHLRPLLVLLMAQATNGLAEGGWQRALAETERRGVDDSLSEGGVLNDWNPEIMGVEGETAYAAPYTISSSSRSTTPAAPRIPVLETSSDPNSPSILPTQRRLASITEMIHVASLLHDDVIDTSELRRGSPSAPQMFGNKLSILSGDFLLGRASVALARLGSREVVELLATVIANLVEGEVMQLKATSEPEETPTAKGFEDYMRKTYLKSASLLAKSARAAVILGGCGGEGEWVKDVAYGYGRNLGMAFQLVDDTFDFLPAAEDLGKPSNGADLRLGLATAPSLFAWEQNPELGPLIKRKFTGPGDVELARELVMKSDGIERTQQLARQFAGEARALVERLPESAARDSLVELTVKVVDRRK